MRVYRNVETSLDQSGAGSSMARSNTAFRLVTWMRDTGETPARGVSGEPARIAETDLGAHFAPAGRVLHAAGGVTLTRALSRDCAGALLSWPGVLPSTERTLPCSY
ncbi:hypothetical protein GCM10027176_01670 [Actinoallomurus bryophytorum]|uniref:Uncharacterized protein n=1 Tax=Actinoallomurus bryophytorum TaxID=1490222 RepID=A0A543CEA1_9ACTN|nr:hypothetical protein FB559_0912 [Actinoallomurus bryophytorum]